MKRPKAAQFDPERFLRSVSLRQIRYFVAAAEFGKVSLAASMVSISPSAVTEAVSELEAGLGARLFDRRPHGLALTDHGMIFLSHCRRILAALKDASNAFGIEDAKTAGSFKLAVSSTVVGYFIAPMLTRFKNAFPNIEVELHEYGRAEMASKLVEGKADLAVAIVSNVAPHSQIQRQTLIQSTRRLWISPGHPFSKFARVSMDAIAEEPYIQLTIDGGDYSSARYWKAIRKVPFIIFRTQSVEAVRSLIAHGHGVTILSDMMYRPWSLEGDRVEVRQIIEPIPSMDTGLLWHGPDLRNDFAEKFRLFCQQEAVQQRSTPR